LLETLLNLPASYTLEARQWRCDPGYGRRSTDSQVIIALQHGDPVDRCPRAWVRRQLDSKVPGWFRIVPMHRILAALAAVLFLSAPAHAAASGAPAVSPDFVMGRPDAPVLIEEFASMTCGHCARFSNDVFPALKAKYIDTGKARYVLRPLLPSPQNVAAAGFLLARCAGPNGYYRVVEGFFRRQEEAYRTGDVRAALIAAAEEGGVSGPAFNACLADPKGQEALDAELEKASGRDVVSTPTFFFNGVKARAGEMNLEGIDAAYAAALKARR
jgi:protein-disulfide isomerase